MTTVTASTGSTPMLTDPNATITTDPTGTPAGATADPAAYPPEYYHLQAQRATLEAEIKSLEAEQWRKVGSANVSMTLAAMFRLQEENARDDAIANGEEPPTQTLSSVMSSSGRSALRSATETSQLLAQKKEELAGVQAQIAQIQASVNTTASTGA
jgi:hypothetical protein